MDLLLREVRKVLSVKKRAKFDKDLKEKEVAEAAKIKIQSSKAKNYVE